MVVSNLSMRVVTGESAKCTDLPDGIHFLSEQVLVGILFLFFPADRCGNSVELAIFFLSFSKDGRKCFFLDTHEIFQYTSW